MFGNSFGIPELKSWAVDLVSQDSNVGQLFQLPRTGAKK